ncbi:MAG: hypothetical protein IJS68_01420, partial [Clostridia bacterium]|nr:hypothetical protein [Clostridia bacterium]
SIVFTAPTYSISWNNFSIRNVQFRTRIVSLAVNEETGDKKVFAGSFTPFWRVNKTQEEFEADLEEFMGDKNLVEYLNEINENGVGRYVILDDNKGMTDERYQFLINYANVLNSQPEGDDLWPEFFESDANGSPACAIDLEDVEDQTYLTAITSMADANNPLIFVAEPTNENNLDK